MLYAGVAGTAMGVLLLELGLTRVFSVVFYYHFAFLAISIALFGLGVGGVFSYAVAALPGRLYAKLGWLSLLNSLLVLVAVWVVLRPNMDLTNTSLAAAYFAASLPFLGGGTILSLALSETVRQVDRVYFFDLAGAATGCLLLVPMLDQLGGVNTLAAVAVLFAVCGIFWFRAAGASILPACAVALALAAFVACNVRYSLFDVTFAKGAALKDEIFVRWNSFSRIAVRFEKGWGGPAIFIDADANTGIATEDVWNFPEDRKRTYLRYQASSLPYAVRPGGKTLIIGPGGGLDVTHALASGSREITGVEINPIIANDVMRERFAGVSKNLYLRPEVRIAVEDGRSYIRRSPEKYQILQATLVDTWASTAAGAFALSENNLYTTEAFTDYLEHLTDDGVMSFTRWGFEPPRESLRLISLAMEALRRLGARNYAEHVVVIREGTRQELEGLGARDTVLISRNPFSPEDLARVREFAATGKFQAVYLPGEHIPNQFSELLRAPDPEAWLRNYRFDVSPVGDNRPFFFYTVQPRDLSRFVMRDSRDPVDYKINRAVPLLFGLVGVSVLATLLVLALPPLLLGTRLPRKKGVTFFLLYFACIGAGYILIEVALIQKFVLFLGHPVYALTVVIFSMLLSSGLGSYCSRRTSLAPRMPGVAAGLVALLAAGITPLLAAGVGWPLWWKVAVTVALIGPLGFAMGMPFPTGLRVLGQWHSPAVRWAWSLNAASSVLGSAGAIFCAIYLGLSQTMLVGATLYVAALLIVRSPGGLLPFSE